MKSDNRIIAKNLKCDNILCTYTHESKPEIAKKKNM